VNEEVAALLTAVAAAYCLEPALLLRPCRRAEVAEARFVLMALLYRRGLGPMAIARLLGKNHSSIVYGLVRAGIRRPPGHLLRRGTRPCPRVLAEVLAIEREAWAS
jgi:hypothetical protein